MAILACCSELPPILSVHSVKTRDSKCLRDGLGKGARERVPNRCDWLSRTIPAIRAALAHLKLQNLDNGILGEEFPGRHHYCIRQPGPLWLDGGAAGLAPSGRACCRNAQTPKSFEQASLANNFPFTSDCYFLGLAKPNLRLLRF